MRHSSVIKSSPEIFDALSARKAELKLTLSDISVDAKKHGRKLPIANLSKYYSKSEKNGMTEEDIRWLMVRHHIPFDIMVGELTNIFTTGKLIFRIPKYNEQVALQELA